MYIKMNEVDWNKNTLVASHDVGDIYLTAVTKEFEKEVKEAGYHIGELYELSERRDEKASELYDKLQDFPSIHPHDYHEFLRY